MNDDTIKLDDIAEVMAYIMSQEKIMSVPPVLIPTEGVSAPKKRPRSQTNKAYIKKDPKEAQSISVSGGPIENPASFPIEKPDVCEEVTLESDILTYEDIMSDYEGDDSWMI